MNWTTETTSFLTSVSTSQLMTEPAYFATAKWHRGDHRTDTEIAGWLSCFSTGPRTIQFQYSMQNTASGQLYSRDTTDNVLARLFELTLARSSSTPWKRTNSTAGILRSRTGRCRERCRSRARSACSAPAWRRWASGAAHASDRGGPARAPSRRRAPIPPAGRDADVWRRNRCAGYGGGMSANPQSTRSPAAAPRGARDYGPHAVRP